MKLCHVIASLEEKYGGPSKSVHALSAALARIGHAVDLLATDPARSGMRVEGRLRVSTFQRDWPQRLSCSAGLRTALQNTAAEIVHHHALWLRTLHYAHRGSARAGAKLVISPRGMMSSWAWRHHGWRKRLSRRLVHRGALEAAAGWHATSAEEAREIRALGFTQPVCIAPNGVDAPDSGATARSAAHWHALCPATATRPVALFYSRFHAKKRVLELIDLWLEQGPADWLLLLVGIPEDYTPEMLERYVQKSSGAGRVAVFSGVGQPPPYAIASLFLLPSHNENFGLVVAEAMAHGVPALVTDATPWREIVRRELGWCVPWAEYAPALRAATAEPVSQLRLRGQRAREWIVREFSWERSAHQLAEFYIALKKNPA